MGGGDDEDWQHSSLEVRGHSNLPNDFLLGLEASQAIASHFGLVESDSLVRRLNDVGYRVAYNSGRPDILFTFQILDVDEPNAMALPGGWIFITRGILDIGLTDAEMANLIGHEISHITHKDFSRQGRLDGLLSLLQTAVVVAVTMAG
ncbi:MAG TPA: M48 family metalloprotease, partial [Syntrophales bacterium]